MSVATVALPATKRRPRYLSLALAATQQAVAYRLSTVSSIIGSFFWVAILYYLWRAAFAGSAAIGGFTWPEMRTYILLAYGINALIGFASASRMMYAIRTGDIVIDLIRPLNYLRVQLALTAGAAVIEAVASGLIIILLGVAIHAVPPASPLAFVLFVASLLLGFVTKFLLVFTISLLCFWTINSTGLNWAQGAVISLLSGTLVPIALLPGWLQAIANVLPMRGIVATPAGIYLGQYTGWTLAGVLALQVAWLAALWLAADRAWPRAFRAVEIQGG